MKNKEKTLEFYKQHKSDFKNDFMKAFNSKYMSKMNHQPLSYTMSRRGAIILHSKDESKLVDSLHSAKKGKSKPFELSDETKYNLICYYNQIKNYSRPINQLKDFTSELFLTFLGLGVK